MSQELKKSITQVDKSTKAMIAAAATLQKQSNELATLTQISSDLAFDIEQKTSELASIETNISDELRKRKAELEISVLENEDRVLQSLMSKRGLATIQQDELESLKFELSNALESNAEKIDEAVAIAERNANIATNAKLANVKADHAVETAQLKAENTALANRIEFLSKSVESLEKMIEQEREARVEMAKNQSQPVVNVSSGK